MASMYDIIRAALMELGADELFNRIEKIRTPQYDALVWFNPETKRIDVEPLLSGYDPPSDDDRILLHWDIAMPLTCYDEDEIECLDIVDDDKMYIYKVDDNMHDFKKMVSNYIPSPIPTCEVKMGDMPRLGTIRVELNDGLVDAAMTVEDLCCLFSEVTRYLSKVEFDFINLDKFNQAKYEGIQALIEALNYDKPVIFSYHNGIVDFYKDIALVWFDPATKRIEVEPLLPDHNQPFDDDRIISHDDEIHIIDDELIEGLMSYDIPDYEKPLRYLIEEAKKQKKNIETVVITERHIFTPEALEGYLFNGLYRWWNISNWNITGDKANMPEPTKVKSQHAKGMGYDVILGGKCK